MVRIVGSLLLVIVGYFGGRVAITAMAGDSKTDAAKTTYSAPVVTGVSSNPFVE